MKYELVLSLMLAHRILVAQQILNKIIVVYPCMEEDVEVKVLGSKVQDSDNT